MKKIIGILGGMGPFASTAFYLKILKLTNAKKDWEHLRVIIDNNPHIPSRSRHVLYNEESPVEGMKKSCKQLEKYPVDVIAIPCNSASYFIDFFKDEISIPILNIIEITSNYIGENYNKAKRVVVFGSAVIYYKKAYKKYLEKVNKELVIHTEEEQRRIENFIEEIKLDHVTEKLKEKIKKFISDLKSKYDVDVIILGCTEFGCIEELKDKTNIVDSSDVLAKYIIENYK